MTGRRSLVGLTCALVLGALLGLAAPGCGDNGQTPSCPPLSLYDINAAGEANSPKVAAERAAAVDAGCMTDLGDAQPAAP
ncbi:MAG TPA: hypothetical protein VLJ38_00440 [Polyangiaceae bacterium]|nr:hypothetical protein [Polyangiaceae bacterium]